MADKKFGVRESVFLLCFEKLLRDDDTEELFEVSKEFSDITVNSQVKKNVLDILDKADEIDKVIEKYSDKRAVSRIPKINLAALRLGIYEALYDDKVPVNVAISEAVNLTQKYALDNDVSFVNGVLGSFAKEVNNKG